MIVKIILLILLLCITGCQKQPDTFQFSTNETKITVSLHQIQDTVFDIQAAVYKPDGDTTLDTWRLNYPVYRFDCADITGDGIPEIAVGVIKPTRFDPIVRKRLFLFKLFDTCYVRPLWLGSKMSLPLVDFRIVNGRVRTIEQEGENSFVVAEYEYKRFGLEWLAYLKRGLSMEEAFEEL
ncbi:MAG: nuclear receptor-binding factor 2 [Bacteroidales bacterium]|nr:nuclear receptor-binding factor 2 [Bacteroidales bacterium]